MVHRQLAIAGRAVKRIAHVTGRPAMTIARFLNLIERQGEVPRRGMLIFDEASMLDAPSVYRILSRLPDEIALLF
ncbi:AAA family ATPase, partial [Klebsiella aerogenes]|uniref:AAA family ATPase n=1 Tax=Klebsiella aerogenes TaxID=548 RepID=UPI001D0E41B1